MSLRLLLWPDPAADFTADFRPVRHKPFCPDPAAPAALLQTVGPLAAAGRPVEAGGAGRRGQAVAVICHHVALLSCVGS